MNNATWNVHSKSSEKTVVFSIKQLWWAAAACVVLFSGIIYYTAFNLKRNTPAAMHTISLPDKELTDAIDTSYTSQMNQFAQLILLKQTELKKNEKAHPGLYKQFLKDNNQLDSSYNYLKKQLSANPNKELLLDAMIQNLQLKIDLLTRQLQIIQQSKNKKISNENKSI
jgi:hypothetical protein